MGTRTAQRNIGAQLATQYTQVQETRLGDPVFKNPGLLASSSLGIVRKRLGKLRRRLGRVAMATVGHAALSAPRPLPKINMGATPRTAVGATRYVIQSPSVT